MRALSLDRDADISPEQTGVFTSGVVWTVQKLEQSSASKLPVWEWRKFVSVAITMAASLRGPCHRHDSS
jgi:hypothetical protein